VEGREHLRRLLYTALGEEDQPFLSDGGRDLWAHALESALDVLADNIARGGWLTGVKRGRMARKAKRAGELKKSEEAKAKKEQEDVNKSKGEGKGVTSKDVPRREEKELPKHPPSLTTESQVDVSGLALREIRDLAARPTLPTPKPCAKHLLLCLVPIGKSLPIEDNDFDLVPHNTGCTFTPGFFSLPEALSDAESGILFGLNEWDG
jgi:1-phosphatidylinositol-3-phosphate 5-kinase